MKVARLIEMLNEADPESEVILSSDGEGNSYRFGHVSLHEFFAHDGNELEVYSKFESDQSEELRPAVVLW